MVIQSAPQILCVKKMGIGAVAAGGGSMKCE